MTCQWCSQESEDTYHPECWSKRNEAHNRKLDELMVECHEAIQDIKAGQPTHVSADCMEHYGAFIKHHRQAMTKGRGASKA